MIDSEFIQKTLKLAKRGYGHVSPNPMVGAIIVKNRRIIGQAYHERFGGEHAEPLAIKNTTESVAGATLYVNLEPCSHQGKQPPCANRIVAAGISRVVIGTADPNPQVNGDGIKFLIEHGIEVTVEVAEQKCQHLNRAFFRYVTTGLPWVTLKIAQTIDGRIAAADQGSKWISGEKSRKYAHKLRAGHDAIIAGIGTVLSDDPQLNVRMSEGKDPRRVVLDSKLRIPLEAKVLTDHLTKHTVVATTAAAPTDKIERIQATGAKVWVLPTDNGSVDLAALCEKLGTKGVASVLVEGGSAVFSAFMRQGLVDELAVFVAPKILGAGLFAIQDLGIESLGKSIKLRRIRSKKMGEDVLLVAEVIREQN